MTKIELAVALLFESIRERKTDYKTVLFPALKNSSQPDDKKTKRGFQNWIHRDGRIISFVVIAFNESGRKKCRVWDFFDRQTEGWKLIVENLICQMESTACSTL